VKEATPVPPCPEPDPEPEALASAVHTLTAVQPYKLEPAGAELLKKSCPNWQLDGSEAPTVTGRVNGWLEKSALRP
jgi:hypothetical protein